MAFDLPADYKQVPERIADLKAQHPDARLRPVNPDEPFKVVTIGDKTFIAYAAACYRDENDTMPGIGVAWEPFPGRTPYTKDSELMNAETSAWGRAIVATLRSESKSVASAEEVRNRQAERDASPPPADGCPLCGKPLRERNGAKGPFVGCSGYPACKFTANGTLAQYTGEADAPSPDDAPLPSSNGHKDLVQQIAELCKSCVSDDIRDAFGAVDGGAACLAPVGDGTWKIRGAALKALSDEAKQEIVARLSAAEVPF